MRICTLLACTITIFALFSLGCQNSATTSTPVDPATAIIGKWKIDVEATKAGWGDRAEDLMRKMVDQLSLNYEIHDDNTITLRRNETESFQGHWSVKSKTEDTVVLSLGMKDSEEPNSEWTFKVLDNDRISYFFGDSPEGIMIMNRQK